MCRARWRRSDAPPQQAPSEGVDASRGQFDRAAPLQVCYLLAQRLRRRAPAARANRAPVRRGRFYVGWTNRRPYTRLAQHNGLIPGGVARLERGRPWRLVLYAHGFPDELRAKRFERAWQRGFRDDALRHTQQFTPSAGPLGRVEILRALLACDAYAWCGLTVHVLRPHSAAAQGELRLYEGARAALRGYARITEGPHGS